MPSSSSPENTAEKLSVKYFQYNNPIGIDFQKSSPPLLYLGCINILDLFIHLPHISTQIRYTLESLRNDLSIGHFTDFQHRLYDFFTQNQNKFAPIVELLDPAFLSNQKGIQKSNLKTKTAHQEPPLMSETFRYHALIFLLGLVLEGLNQNKHQWITIDQLKKFIENQDQRKTQLRDWASLTTLTAEDSFVSLLANMILSVLSKEPLAKPEAGLWLSIRKMIAAGEFKDASKEIKKMLQGYPIAHLEQTPSKSTPESSNINDNFSNCGLIGLFALWMSMNSVN
jgi:hypothetical protein